MKTPEEIKRGMVHCSNDSTFCNAKCPYFNASSNGVDCATEMHGNGLAYIQQLEQDNAQKDERIRQLEREKEALLNSVSRLCIYCKNQGVPSTNEPCYSCVRTGRNNWEWRGVEEDEA